MKKVILGGIAAIAIAALAVVNVNVNSQNDNLLFDLALANVEALAQESGGTGTQYIKLTLTCYKVVYGGVLETNGTYTSCSYGGYASCTPTSCN
jgi:hypothetical protein